MPRSCTGLWLGGLILLYLGPTAPAAEEPEKTAPVPLYSPALRTPIDVAGTGIAPEVTVRVHVDVRGRVSEIEIESIQPSSEYDAIFEERVQATLSRWRFAPATLDGEPVETSLGWMVQFSEIEAEAAEAGGEDLAWRSIDRQRHADEYRQRMLSLPLEQRIKHLVEQSEIARDCLDETKIRRHNSERFMIFTDAPKADVAQVLASNLEATFDALHSIVGAGVGPQPESNRLVVFMYAHENGFSQLKQRVRAQEWSAGFYNPIGLLAFHMQMPSNVILLHSMLHEATHAYIDRYLARPGVVFPRWLDEGFAEYVGNSQIRKGELIPGKTRRGELYRSPWGSVRGKSHSRHTVDSVRAAMRKGKLLSIADLISADIIEFQGERRLHYYAVSWMLVHFLRHGREDWAELFPTLMLYVAEGYSADQAFRAVYGDPAGLQQEFEDYVKKF